MSDAEARGLAVETRRMAVVGQLEGWRRVDNAVSKIIDRLEKTTGSKMGEWPVESLVLSPSSKSSVELFVKVNFREILRLSPICLWGEFIAFLGGDLPLSLLERNSVISVFNAWSGLLSCAPFSANIEREEATFSDLFCSLVGWSRIRQKYISTLTYYEARVDSTRIRLPPMIALRFAYRADGDKIEDLARDKIGRAHV